MDKYLVEVIGTFFLVLTVGLTAGLGNAGALAPVAIGAILMVMVFAGGHVSGAHYNPAVTVAICMRGKCPRAEVAGYVVAQVVGAGLAALVVRYLAQGASLAASTPAMGPTLVVELLFTFALCWVVLNTATARGTEGNSFYGLAIGSTVAAGAFAVGPISGAVFNPAVAVGICIMGLSQWAFIWVYLVATIAAAVLAALAFKALIKD